MAGLLEAREPKVCDSHAPVLVDKEVAAGQVAVDDPLPVEVEDACGGVGRHAHEVGPAQIVPRKLGRAPPNQHVLDAAAGHEARDHGSLGLENHAHELHHVVVVTHALHD